MVWVEPVATSKLLGCPHSPHQRGFCTEGLLNRHALDMLGRTWNVCMDMHNTASKSMLQNGSMSKYKLRMLCCAWWSLLPVCISLNTLWSLSIFVVHIRSTKNLRIRIHIMHSLWLPCIQCVCLWYYWPWENFQDHIPMKKKGVVITILDSKSWVIVPLVAGHFHGVYSVQPQKITRNFFIIFFGGDVKQYVLGDLT